MKTFFYLFIVPLLFASACSSGVKVSSSYEENIDFSNYATYKVLPIGHEGTDSVAYSEENKQLIRDAIIHELEAMNYTQEESNPDLMVYATIAVVEKEQKRERTFRDGPSYSGQRRYSWSASDSILVGYYDEGSLVINLIDAEKNELVWHATARKALKDNPTDKEEKIRQAVADMFKEYPGNPTPPTSFKME